MKGINYLFRTSSTLAVGNSHDMIVKSTFRQNMSKWHTILPVFQLLMEDAPISASPMQTEMSGSQNHAKYASATQDLFSAMT